MDARMASLEMAIHQMEQRMARLEEVPLLLAAIVRRDREEDVSDRSSRNIERVLTRMLPALPPGASCLVWLENHTCPLARIPLQQICHIASYCEAYPSGSALALVAPVFWFPQPCLQRGRSVASFQSIPEIMRIAVGQAHGPHRIMINHSNFTQTQWDAGQTMTTSGWTHRIEFWAYSTRRPGTIRIAVGQAHGPHRTWINHSNFTQDQWDAGQTMTTAGWTHHVEFWAYPTRQPGTIRIAVGRANGPHRIMINHSNFTQDQWDAGQMMTTAGWTHHLEFWAFPPPPPCD
mmetsp:Transcript_95021/g.271699  ORF Transcript_95021/g.271699 Transcript_95021/m.271699 type:complete len:290 (+) Transcript_95021:147-1016(+)